MLARILLRGREMEMCVEEIDIDSYKNMMIRSGIYADTPQLQNTISA
jgi:hypothetical protein